VLATPSVETVKTSTFEWFVGVVAFLAHEALSLVDAGEFLIGEAGVWVVVWRVIGRDPVDTQVSSTLRKPSAVGILFMLGELMLEQI